MSLKLWCPDCATETVVDMMSIYDGYEFTCDDCKQVFYIRIERGLSLSATNGNYCTCTTELQYHDGLGWVCMYCDRPRLDP